MAIPGIVSIFTLRALRRLAGVWWLPMALLMSANSGALGAEPADAYAAAKLIGRGINLGNALEAPTEGEWGVTIKEDYFDVIKAAGFDSVRIAIRWSAHALPRPPFTVNPDFFRRIDEVTGQAAARGETAIITMHHYDELYADPAGHRERFLAIWRQIAEHFQDRSRNLLFEPLNEPHDNLTAHEWNRLLRDVLAVIRPSNPNRTILLGPANYNDIRQLAALELPGDDRQLVIALHYYLPYPFTHQGAHWVAGSEAWLGTRWTNSDAEQAAIGRDFDLAAAWAKAHDRPVCFVEFGANSKADMESRAQWTRCVATAATERGFAFTYWDFCAEFFGAYDPVARVWRKSLLNALIPSAAVPAR